MRIHDTIDQSLYSRRVMKADDTIVMFFCSSIGQYDEKGEEIVTIADTNLYSASNLHVMMTITAIRFNEWKVDKKLRDHLMEYGYFLVRVVDRDYLQYPIHLMDNYFFFMEKKLEIPIIINPYENFSVYLHLTKSYRSECKLTCELLGIMRRSI